MTEWMWVALGYGLAYGSIATYLLVLSHRWNAVRGKGNQQ